MIQKQSITLGALVLAASLAFPAAAEEQVIAIGYQAPLTGEYAQYGVLFRNAASLAVDEFNQSGRLSGVKVALKFEDSKGDAKEGVNIARKFSEDQQILVSLETLAQPSPLLPEKSTSNPTWRSYHKPHHTLILSRLVPGSSVISQPAVRRALCSQMGEQLPRRSCSRLLSRTIGTIRRPEFCRWL